MNERIQAAEQALDTATESIRTSGLADALHDLVGEVWSTNLARYAPEEHGDTTKSLGTQCYENLRELSLRRFLGDQLLDPEEQWLIPGLLVSTPQSVLTLTLDGFHIVTKKVPHAQGRNPIWTRFPEWDAESHSRHDIARENARVLGGNPLSHPEQAELDLDGDARLRPSQVRNFMLVWAGDEQSGATSAWLTVPVSWPGMHFAGIAQLWSDEISSLAVPAPRSKSGPTTQSVPEPVLRLKPRAGSEESNA